VVAVLAENLTTALDVGLADCVLLPRLVGLPRLRTQLPPKLAVFLTSFSLSYFSTFVASLNTS
jgi:hypothetical protein